MSLRTTLGVDAFWSAFSAEIRSLRRSIGLWVCVLPGVALTLALTSYYALVHGASATWPEAGYLQPRFLISEYAAYQVWLGSLAIAFLDPHLRAEDQRTHVAEVLGAKPISNVALVAARVLALTTSVWFVVVCTLAVVQGIGWVFEILDTSVGQRFEPLSVAAFVLLDAFPTLLLWSSVVAVLTVALRNRLLVALVFLVLVGMQIAVVSNMPVHLAAALWPGPMVGYASDVAPRFTDSWTLVQRASVIVLAGGLMTLAALLYPRTDGGRAGRRLFGGLTISAIGVGGIAAVAFASVATVELRNGWLATHQSVGRSWPNADIEWIRGDVGIEPGVELRLDLDILVRFGNVDQIDRLDLTFNPGLLIRTLLVDGVPARFKQVHGLVRIKLTSLGSDNRTRKLQLSAAGSPDLNFAYLDSAVDPSRLRPGNRILKLGSEAAIFDDDYVALMPGIHWLPSVGSVVDWGDPSRRPRDYHNVDLRVDVPSGWVVAGPSRRIPVGDGGSTFRFRGTVPVWEVGIFASRFAIASNEISGTRVELLLHRRHLDNVELFLPYADAIEHRLATLLAEAARLGLPYPYDNLSIVETPSRLRSYRGGWELRTSSALPGVLLLNEVAWPTARFDQVIKQIPEAGREGMAVVLLEAYAHSDFVGSLFDGFARHLFDSVTGAAGPHAAVVNFVCHDLTKRLLVGEFHAELPRGLRSAHAFDAVHPFVGAAGHAAYGFFNRGLGVLGRFEATADKPAIWEQAVATPLSEIDPSVDPVVALGILALRGGGVAASIIKGGGQSHAARLLGELRSQHAGRNFLLEDFAAVADELALSIPSFLGDWLEDASLPGFLASPAKIIQLSGDRTGPPKHQITVHVRNDEAAPGLVSVDVDAFGSSEHTQWVVVGPKSTVEIGFVKPVRPEELWLHTSLALNRSPVRIPVGKPLAASGTDDVEPFIGVRTSRWTPPVESGIVVDDLDAGFSVVKCADCRTPRRALSKMFAPRLQHDAGLPVYDEFSMSPRPGQWYRQLMPSGWGRYRHTVVRAIVEAGAPPISFAASLPHSGRWQLEYHLPDGALNAFSEAGTPRHFDLLDTVRMTIRSNEMEAAVVFDGGAAEPGWNKVGIFQLGPGKVDLVVNGQSNGKVIIADAIRWLVLRGNSK